MRRPALRALPVLVACVVFAAENGTRTAPVYSQSSLVNLGSGEAGRLAPNTLAVIYGENLASSTVSRIEAYPAATLLPTLLPATGVTVKVNGILAGIEYASPNAVIFVVPPELLPGPARVVLTRNGVNGPSVQIRLEEVAPSLLPLDAGWTLARRGDTLEWCLPGQAAAPGQEVILYGTGWGASQRPPVNLLIPEKPYALKAREALRVFLDGMEVAPGAIVFAGLVPGAPGLYQLRLRLPDWVGTNPEVRIAIGDQMSQPGLRLPVERPQAQPDGQRMRSTQ